MEISLNESTLVLYPSLAIREDYTRVPHKKYWDNWTSARRKDGYREFQQWGQSQLKSDHQLWWSGSISLSMPIYSWRNPSLHSLLKTCYKSGLTKEGWVFFRLCYQGKGMGLLMDNTYRSEVNVWNLCLKIFLCSCRGRALFSTCSNSEA